jgi:hypothetical protein
MPADRYLRNVELCMLRLLVAQALEYEPLHDLVEVEEPMSLRYLIVILAIVGLFVWWALWPKYDFRIDIKNGDLRYKGTITETRKRRIADFFKADLPDVTALSAHARRVNTGRWTFAFNGAVDEGTRQRIRNFLTATL